MHLQTHSRLLTEWALESSDGREHVLRLFGCILSISACNAQYPTEETISEIPFGFWYILQVRSGLAREKTSFLVDTFAETENILKI